METKTVTLVPDAYWTGNRWDAYSGENLFAPNQEIHFRVPANQGATFGSFRLFTNRNSSHSWFINIPNKGPETEYLVDDIWYFVYDELRGYYTCNGQLKNQEYIYISARGDDASDYVGFSKITATASYNALSIDAVEPYIAKAVDEVTITFSAGFKNLINLTLTANNKTIATFSVPQGESTTYTFTCGTDWFTKAGATGNEFDITVTAVEDGVLQRTAKSSFKFKREGIGTEITQQPISTGSNQQLKLKFNNRNGHELHLLIEGTAKGSSNRVKLVPSTSASYVTVSADTYTVTAADSWFDSINGSEMSVYITVTDAVDGRQDKLSAFTLKAGDALLPTISSIIPLNISGSTLLDDYGYVVGYSRIEIRVNGTTYSGTSVQSIIAKVGTEQITCSYNSTKQAYVGETSGTISSKSRITVTVTVTDSRGRINTGYAYIEASDITVLPNIGLVQQGTIYAGDSFYISPTGCIGDYKYSITTAKYVIAYRYQGSGSTKVLTTYAGYFKNSSQAGLPSINLNITITDKLGRSANFTFVVLAPLPQILSFAYVHVPDDRMPESASVQPTKVDVVSGYSKINFTARVRWYCEPGSVVVKDQSNNANTLSLASNYSSATFPKDADYSYTSDDVISTTYSQLVYTLTAKDTGVITSGTYRRTGEKLSSKITIAIYRLQNMTVTPPSTVDTDAQATIRVNNFVGSYDYEAKIANDTVSESEEPIITPTFSVFADPAWFESASTPTLTVYVTVEDVLGRTQTVSFTVRLNRFVLTLAPTGDIQIDGAIQISVEGSGSQQVAIVLTTPKGGETLELASTTATTTSPATVTCPQTWFTDHSEFDNVYQLPITVTASYAGRSTSQRFKLVYPSLGLTLQKSDGSGDTATEAEVGDSVIYSFANQEGESVTVRYYYSNISTPIRSLLPYSASSVTIATPQLFDNAAALDSKANTLRTMNVRVVISDKRGRTAKVDNFTIKASDSMKPRIVGFPRLYSVNPSTVASEFQDKFFNGISKFRVTASVLATTSAEITKVYVRVNGLKFEMSNTQDIDYEYQSEEFINVSEESSLYHTGTLSVFVKAVDKRGLESAWYGLNQEVIIYRQPQANISYRRCNSDRTPNDAGTYCDLQCNWILDWLYTKYVPGEQQQAQNEVTVSVNTTGYSVTEQLISGEMFSRFLIPDMDMERTYDITITITDLITSTSYTVRLSTAGVIMDFLRNGKGLALGKVAEHQGMVEVNPEWTFQAEKMKVRVKDGTDDKGMYDVGQLLCQILNRMTNGGL